MQMSILEALADDSDALLLVLALVHPECGLVLHDLSQDGTTNEHHVLLKPNKFRSELVEMLKSTSKKKNNKITQEECGDWSHVLTLRRGGSSMRHLNFCMACLLPLATLS